MSQRRLARTSGFSASDGTQTGSAPRFSRELDGRFTSIAGSVSLHTSQVNINDAAITEPVRAFFRRIGPKGVGYYFPKGTSNTTLGGVQEAWEEMCACADIQGPNGTLPNLELLASSAIQVLSEKSRK